MTKSCFRVLLVEDSPSDARLIQQSLLGYMAQAFAVTVVERLDAAIARLQREQFDVLLLDLALPDSTGIETLIRMSEAAPEMPIVVLTGADDKTISVEAIKHGGQDYLVKGHADGQIVANAIRYAILRKDAEKELKFRNEELEHRVAERTAVAENCAEQLRHLAAELTLAEHRERRRLARILHDGLQQTLVAVKYGLALIKNSDDPCQEAEKIALLIDEAIQTSRSLTSELSPPTLMTGELPPMLRWLAEWFSERHGLEVRLNARDDMGTVPEEITVLLFQSIRELLFNVVQHAEVKSAQVGVIQRANFIFVTVSDEGVGFNPGQLRAEGGDSRGFGLFSIGERLRYLGGKLDIDSAVGQGSRFSLIIPCPATVATGRESLSPRMQVKL
jgi:signal transduction histidine kinase